ncbi:MAG: hypothetical protein PHP76_07430 [Bacteroidales bacterium]|nr:hypothetical protein [Bacteroidales bacterium]
MEKGCHLGIRLANQKTSERGDVSDFFIYDNADNEDPDILKYIHALPTSMSAWQVYMRMTSTTVMPAFWHGEYAFRKFIFKEKELQEIYQLKNLDLSAPLKDGLLYPSVQMETESSTNQHIAHVYCSYWSKWRGLVQENHTN